MSVKIPYDYFCLTLNFKKLLLMKKTFSSRKSAFSLIELSIVLIVIGLLIAGITGGASLIKSSELRSAMGEARGYAVAVNAFYTQFNALPGDFGTNVAATNEVAGDNDGTIEYYSDATIAVAEGVQAWNDLEAIGAIDDSLDASDAVGTAQVVGDNMPSSKIKSAGWAFDYTASSQNVVVLNAGISTGTASTDTASALSTGAIVPADALSIDVKIDDGIANTGKVRGVLSACLDTTTTYDVTETSKACALSYQVDVNS